MIFIKLNSKGVLRKENPRIGLWSYSVLPEIKEVKMEVTYYRKSWHQHQDFQMEKLVSHKLGKQSDVCLSGTDPEKGEVSFSPLSWLDRWI